MDILECEVCNIEVGLYVELVQELGGYYCPYCGHKEEWK